MSMRTLSGLMSLQGFGEGAKTGEQETRYGQPPTRDPPNVHTTRETVPCPVQTYVKLAVKDSATEKPLLPPPMLAVHSADWVSV